MNQKTALRIAHALERIADRLELLTVETVPAQPETPSCLHPSEERLDLGMTTGWVCQVCGHTESPT